MARNILIVDDSATTRRITIRSLRQAGVADVEFTEVDGAAAGLKALQSRTFDLILSDVDMPSMNGSDFCEALRAKMSAPPPIVMITTEGSEESAKEALSHGAKGYLKKPLTPEMIDKVIGPFLK